jgi:hypothetical protein
MEPRWDRKRTARLRSRPLRSSAKRHRDGVLSLFAKEKGTREKYGCRRRNRRYRGDDDFFLLFSLDKSKEKEAQEKDLVRMRGLEPPRLAPLPPQSSVSTSSTTSAPKTAVDRRGRSTQSLPFRQRGTYCAGPSVNSNSLRVAPQAARPVRSAMPAILRSSRLSAARRRDQSRSSVAQHDDCPCKRASSSSR